MRKILLLFCITLFCFSGSASGIDSVYFTADSAIWVVEDTLYIHHLGGGDVKIGINCYNETAIAGLTYPFIELCGAADIDPAKNNDTPYGETPKCFIGGRIDNLDWVVMVLNTNEWPPQFMISAANVLSASHPNLMPGDGYIAKIILTLPGGSPDTCICIDTMIHPPNVVLAHCDTFGINEWSPHFTPKCFTIKRKPPIDSVYLTADSGVAVIGDTIYMHPLGGGNIKIGVNCYNETAIAALVYPLVELCHAADLPLHLNDRGETPICYLGGRVEQIDWGVMAFHPLDLSNRRLILLGATAMMRPPLMPGDGYIAKLTFTLPFGATDTCICLDTSFFPPSSILTHVDTNCVGYKPEFTKRCFSIKRRSNTPPVITQPAEVLGYGQFDVSWQVSATDPEGDEVDSNISIIVIDQTTSDTIQPPGSYVTVNGSNPWTLTFNRFGLELGEYHIWVYIQDEHGAMDSCMTKTLWQPFFIVAKIDSLDCVFSGQVAEIPVNIFSGVNIGGFKFYIEYDPNILTFLSVERGDLIDDFDGYWDEYGHVPRYSFQYFEHRMLPCEQQCETYKIKIVGIADMPDGWITGPIPFGEGELFKLKFMVAKDANLQDLFLPVIWEFDYDFDMKAPSFSSTSGDSLYVDVNWPGETSDPNHSIFPIVTFENGGVKICSDAYCWTGDLNLNEYPYEIADAVLYANYFIYGPEVFDIDFDLQLLASDVNKDGFYPSIADFVFLIRIILEDISPKHKPAPSTDIVDVTLTTQGDLVKVITNSCTSIGAALYVFKHTGEIKNLTSHTDMDIKYHDANGELRVLVYNFEGKSIPAGEVDLLSFQAKEIELVEVNAADFYGSAMKSTITTKVLPTRFALMNNYPNPFNLSTNISFSLPEESDISLKLYNIAGQLVKSFEGVYQTGNHTIVWDGTNTRGEEVSSGIYFYRLMVGDYKFTRKMVLMK